MNDIIKKIEAEQLKENAPEFNVGDTKKYTRRLKRETAKESRFLKEQF